MLGVLGCQSQKGMVLKPPDILTMNQTLGTTAYVLGPGDLIAVKLLYNEELNTEATISPDGNISLPLLGQVRIAGKTLSQAESLIENKFSEEWGFSSKTYTLGVGDTIAVKFYYNSDLNEEVTIRPDGNISLHLIGEVKAAGLKPAQLDSILTHRYSKLLKSSIAQEIAVIVKDYNPPEVTVTVKDSASQIVFIGGEVAQPRMIPIRGILRTLDASIRAGGILKTAKLENIAIFRYNGSQKPDVYLLNMEKVLSGDIPDVTLKPYDIVYIPKTTMSKVDDFMQHIWNIIPFRVNLIFPYDLNPPDTDVTVTPSP
jgi:protein involved in polysaccharide export with SLBB domain